MRHSLLIVAVISLAACSDKKDSCGNADAVSIENFSGMIRTVGEGNVVVPAHNLVSNGEKVHVKMDGVVYEVDGEGGGSNDYDMLIDFSRNTVLSGGQRRKFVKNEELSAQSGSAVYTIDAKSIAKSLIDSTSYGKVCDIKSAKIHFTVDNSTLKNRNEIHARIHLTEDGKEYVRMYGRIVSSDKIAEAPTVDTTAVTVMRMPEFAVTNPY